MSCGHNQQDIDLEVCACRLLRVMHIFDPYNDSEGLAWTTRLLSDATGYERDAVEIGLRWLKNRDYIAMYRGAYIITIDGREYFSGVLAHSSIGNPHIWKDEVLTGITKNGKPTTIKNPVVPGNKNYSGTAIDPENIISRYEFVLRLKQKQSEALGITLEEYDSRLLDGSLQYCRGLTKDGDGHIGIFDPKKKGWQHLCRKCRKQKRN